MRFPSAPATQRFSVRQLRFSARQLHFSAHQLRFSARQLRFSPSMLLAACSLLAGCSGSFDLTSSDMTGSSGLAGLRGIIHGGQQPVAESHLYVYAAATGGYGGASVSLLSAYSGGSFPTAQDASGSYYITSDSNGDFALTGEYACTAGQQVYLYASGGNPGAGENPALGLMAALGQCPASGSFATSTPFIVVNEITTVAAAYALAGFATDSVHVADDEAATGNATKTQAEAGMANAFANASNLANPATGAALATTPAGNGVVPQAEIDTLANILAACVNSTGSTTGCTSLLQAATADGTSTGARPTDTATAALNIAHHPATAANLGLISLQTADSPFQPSLNASNTPNDFTLGLTFTGGGLSYSYAIAIDGAGNAWIANLVSGGVTELSPKGQALSPSSGILYKTASNDPIGVAVDIYGNIWLADTASNSPVKLSSTGALLSPSSGYGGGGVQGPLSIASDGQGNVWIANSSGGLSEFSNSGAALSPSTGYSSVAAAAAGQAGVAVDSNGDAWAATAQSLAELSPTGGAISPSAGFTGAGLYHPSAVAIDGAGDVWAGNELSSLSELSNTGSPLSPSAGFTGGGLYIPTGIAIDGAGNAWVCDYTGQSDSTAKLGNISEFSSGGAPVSPAYGYLGGGLSEPQAIALDPSGDVWVANIGASASLPGYVYYPNSTVSEFIGASAPVVAPLSAGAEYNKLGARP